MKKEQEKLRENANIYDILKQEHKDVKKLFKQIVDEERFNDSVYIQIKKGIDSCTWLEKKNFSIPRLKTTRKPELTLESYEEHELSKKDNTPT